VCFFFLSCAREKHTKQFLFWIQSTATDKKIDHKSTAHKTDSHCKKNKREKTLMLEFVNLRTPCQNIPFSFLLDELELSQAEQRKCWAI